MVPSTQPNLAYPMAEVRSGGAGRQAAGLPDAAPPRATPKTVQHCLTLLNIVLHMSVTAPTSSRHAWNRFAILLEFRRLRELRWMCVFHGARCVSVCGVWWAPHGV